MGERPSLSSEWVHGLTLSRPHPSCNQEGLDRDVGQSHPPSDRDGDYLLSTPKDKGLETRQYSETTTVRGITPSQKDTWTRLRKRRPDRRTGDVGDPGCVQRLPIRHGQSVVVPNQGNPPLSHVEICRSRGSLVTDPLLLQYVVGVSPWRI